MKNYILFLISLNCLAFTEEFVEERVETPTALEETAQVPVQEELAPVVAAEHNEPQVAKILSPQDLQTTLESTKKGDILIFDGTSKWYKIEEKTLTSGARVYVLHQE